MTERQSLAKAASPIETVADKVAGRALGRYAGQGYDQTAVTRVHLAELLLDHFSDERAEAVSTSTLPSASSRT